MKEPDLQCIICLITDRLNITGAKLAEWLDIDPPVISKIKSGHKKDFGKLSDNRGGRTITPDSFFADVFEDEIVNALNYSKKIYFKS